MINLIGQNLGQYKILAKLGQGGMASVYRARQETMFRDVAIKVIDPQSANSADFLKRFERETRTVASLSHPNIIKVFDFGQDKGIVYLVMELLPGGSLADVMRTQTLSTTRISELLTQIGSALDYAHQNGIIHRDLKPQNIILDNHGHPYLSDFGIAKLLTDAATAITQLGVTMGTPSYMAPEQWLGKPIDNRADLYALGVMLFEMLTGRKPYLSETPFGFMHQHVYDPPPMLHTLRADLPTSLQPVLEKVLAKDRDQRYGSARELTDAFNTVLASPAAKITDDVVQAPTPMTDERDPVNTFVTNPVNVSSPSTPSVALSTPTKTVKPNGSIQNKRSPVTAFLGIALLLIILGASAVILSNSGKAPTPTHESVVAALPTNAIRLSPIGSPPGNTDTVDSNMGNMGASSGQTPTGGIETQVASTLAAMRQLTEFAFASATKTATDTATPSQTPIPSATASNTVTDTPTNTMTNTPTDTATVTDTSTATVTATDTVTATPSVTATLEPSATLTLVPVAQLPSPTPVIATLPLTAVLPGSSDMTRYKDIWYEISGQYKDMSSPDVQTYFNQIALPTTGRTVSFDWCADRVSEIPTVIDPVKVDFTINNIVVDPAVVLITDYKKGGRPCRTWLTLLTNWKPGGYVFDIRYTLTKKVVFTDGTTYQAGKYIQRINLTVK